MSFSSRSHVLFLALALSGAAQPARPEDEPRITQPAGAPDAPSSDAVAPASQLNDAKPVSADPVAADALRITPGAGEAATEPMPAAVSAYAAPETEAGVAFPTPDAAVSPAAPVPEIADPGKSAFLGETDLSQLKQAIDLYRRGRFAEGDAMKGGFKDPAARALLEWVAIRAGTGMTFDRIATFAHENPEWPFGPLMRRRIEERLLLEKKNPEIVRAYFGSARPQSAPGKLALALAFRASALDGDAANLVRDLWRQDDFGKSFETKVLEAFPGILTQVDHRYRMERALLKESWELATRAADYAGGAYPSLVRARRVVESKGSGAPAALNAVPPALRNDSSFMLSRAQYYRRADKPQEAAKILAAAPTNPEVLADGDEWWVERRVVARKLMDAGDTRTAYALTSAHSARTVEKRIEAEFHAGWIALRFENDAAAAERHFAKAAEIAETPISVARAVYWQGRAAEALGKSDEAKIFYERAGQWPIAYYGQLARVRLGQYSLPLREASTLDTFARRAFDERLFVRALKLLTAASMKDLALPLYIDASKALSTEAELNALGDVAAELRDARALVALGKLGTQRGLALDTHAFPTLGIPDYEAFTAVTQVEKAMVFAIARQESQFDPRAQSGVGARGLMQMMPATAQRTAKRVSAGFELGRLTSDPAFNARLGQAHLGELMEDWRGSYILAFASYNAGGGNVKKWIDAYGDPRNPQVDPIDWVERIPFTETRNYVQRVMENLQIYRNRLDGKTALGLERDLTRGAKTSISADARPRTP